VNNSLTSRQQQYITQKVESGAYASPDEVIREGLRLLEAEEKRRKKIESLRIEVEKGFEGPLSEWTKADSSRIRRMVMSKNRQSRGKR
jgi:putative addiction module CopG family antidote